MSEPVTDTTPVATVHRLDDRRDARGTLVVDLAKTPTATAPDAEDAPAGEAVDRPDNPLADWLALPDADVLPAWARSRASVVANVQAFGRLTWWHTRYHGLRTPKYLVKTVLLAARGFSARRPACGRRSPRRTTARRSRRCGRR